MNKQNNYLFIAIIALTLMNILTMFELSKTQFDLTILQKRTLSVSNRLALVEGHIPSLDLNDERMYKYVRDLNFNNQVHTARIDWLESILITIEYVE